jgi:hypothetical protein
MAQMALFALLASACTRLPEHAEVRVTVAADPGVISAISQVSLVVELAAPGGGWTNAETRRFELPDSTRTWPLQFTLAGIRQQLYGRYQLTATARDARDAVVAQARTIREFRGGDVLELNLRLEAACMFREMLCGAGTTCHEGSCVDAASLPDLPVIAADGGMSMLVNDNVKTGGAADALPCAVAGTRSCAGSGSRIPLLCDGAAWRAQNACADDERCSNQPGPDQGRCLPVLEDCRAREPDAAFRVAGDPRAGIRAPGGVGQGCAKNESSRERE